MATNGGNSFAGIDAGTSTATFALNPGRYVVDAAPQPTAPGEWGGLCSLQKQTPVGAVVSVGASTDFAKRNSVTVHLNQGTYRFTATRTGAILASVTGVSS
jgi:hypothetical protein